MFSRQTFDTLDDPTSSPPPEEAEVEEEDEIQLEQEPEMEEVEYCSSMEGEIH